MCGAEGVLSTSSMDQSRSRNTPPQRSTTVSAQSSANVCMGSSFMKTVFTYSHVPALPRILSGNSLQKRPFITVCVASDAFRAPTFLLTVSLALVRISPLVGFLGGWQGIIQFFPESGDGLVLLLAETLTPTLAARTQKAMPHKALQLG